MIEDIIPFKKVNRRFWKKNITCKYSVFVNDTTKYGDIIEIRKHYFGYIIEWNKKVIAMPKGIAIPLKSKEIKVQVYLSIKVVDTLIEEENTKIYIDK